MYTVDWCCVSHHAIHDISDIRGEEIGGAGLWGGQPPPPPPPPPKFQGGGAEPPYFPLTMHACTLDCELACLGGTKPLSPG